MVHPNIEAAYREAELPYEKNTNDLIEMAFKESIKDSSKKEPKETQKRINSIYRVRVGGNKEYLLWFVTETAEDHLGNRHDWTHLEGKYKHPVFSKRFNQATGQPQAAGLLDTETRYTEPYTGPGSVDKILAMGTQPAETQFYVDTGYAVFANYGLEEFKSKSFYELEQKGITGKYPRQEEIDRQKQLIRAIPTPRTEPLPTAATATTTTAAESLSATTDPKLAAEIERWQERSRGEEEAAAESTPKISSDSPNSKMALGENVVVKVQRQEEQEEEEDQEQQQQQQQQTLRQRQQQERQRRSRKATRKL